MNSEAHLDSAIDFAFVKKTLIFETREKGLINYAFET